MTNENNNPRTDGATSDSNINPAGGSAITGSGGSTSYGTGSNLGSTGSGTNSAGSGIGSTPSGTSGASNVPDGSAGSMAPVGDAAEASGVSAGVVSILERFGVSEHQLNAVKETFKSVNIEDSLDKAKESVTESMNKAREYAKQNPGAVLAGLAVLVIGAGLIAGAAVRRKGE